MDLLRPVMIPENIAVFADELFDQFEEKGIGYLRLEGGDHLTEDHGGIEGRGLDVIFFIHLTVRI